MNIDTSGTVPESNTRQSKTALPYLHKQSELLSDSMIINTLMNNSEDMIYFKDINSRFILNNRAHAARFGVSDPKDLRGKSDMDFYSAEFADKLYQDEQEIMRTGNPIINQMEHEMLSSSKLLTLSSSKYPLFDRDGKIIGTWGISRDMTQLARAESALAKANERLEALSLIDELSGLYNQRHFYNTLELTIKRYLRKGTDGVPADFSLILMDIDNFKHVNDTFGHVIGDTAIRYVSGLIMANTLVSDTSFRYGGDEYAVIMPDTELASARELAERLRRTIEQNPLLISDKRIELTLSMGVISFDGDISAAEMVRKADLKLYQAKREGRNRVC